jgi:outer membrane protein TolC
LKRPIIITMSICLLTFSGVYANTESINKTNVTVQNNNITLEQAIEKSLEDNPTISKSKMELEQAIVAYDKSKYDLRQARPTYGDSRKDSVDYLQNIALVELTGNFAKANAERNHEATIEGLKAKVEDAYFNLLLAKKHLDINEQNEGIAQDLFKKTKKKFDLGLITKQDVLNSEMNMIQANSAVKSAQNSLEKAKMNFNIILGQEVTHEFNLTDELEQRDLTFDVASIDVSEFVSKALENRNEVKAAEFAYEVAKINMDITAKLHPEITFVYREQKVNHDQSIYNLENLKKNIEMEIRSNYMDVLQNRDQIASSEKSVELAKEAFRIAQVMFDSGITTSDRVQSAQTALTEASLGLARNILSYNLSLLNFEDSISIGRSSN